MAARAPVKTRKSAPGQTVSIGPATSEAESVVRSQLAIAETFVVSPEDIEARRQRIAEAAYLRAASRGFAPGAELEDWLQAEAAVDASCGEPHQVVG